MKTKVEELIEQAYERLKETDAVSALHLLEEALKIDFEHPEVKYGLKCINWWLERLKKLGEFSEPFEKGGYVISQWKPFHVFLDQIGDQPVSDGSASEDSCLYAVRHYVFSLALKFLEDVIAVSGNSPDPEILLQMGRCYKEIGNYEEAAKFLEQAVNFRPEDSGALAELADVKAILGDPRAAKVLFREAFYLDPQAIDLWFMESEMIIRLKQKVSELGYTGKEIAEWIPVYGALWGIFSVQRELKPVELGKLRQSILALESENSNKPGDFLKPRLLNRYFRLIDHYGVTRTRNHGDNSDVVEETMRKIKFIDSAIYEQYRN
ncbi:MAG: tetratricopeptide repeat protein [Treponema sp.]|nr:tetratricopeptide repeat protein [Treponema sp.]